jgi:hypothetical protein
LNPKSNHMVSGLKSCIHQNRRAMKAPDPANGLRANQVVEHHASFCACSPPYSFSVQVRRLSRGL